MPRLDVVVSCPVHDSFRVQQVAGMFDVPLAQRLTERFAVDLPDFGSEWRVGLIVGPSGSGKTTVARQLFGDQLSRSAEWASDRAVIDGFGDLPIKYITNLLTAVGFGSPPSWIKPYHVLSNGERFRCDLARMLAQAHTPPGDCSARCVVAVDEFTSVVDRNVARVGSLALSKALRSEQLACRFVAVTCHYDVAPWLQPDWTLDMATREFHRRRLRRPDIVLQVFRCHRSLWSMFARHHYLTGSLPNAARCFVALWKGLAVAFCATVSLIGHKHRWRITRLVTLPDYQGIGIGMRLAEAVASIHQQHGERVNVTASHPSLIHHCANSPRWRHVGLAAGGRPGRRFIHNYCGSPGRTVISFEFIGDFCEQHRT